MVFALTSATTQYIVALKQYMWMYATVISLRRLYLFRIALSGNQSFRS
jgi:hypothetical protein